MLKVSAVGCFDEIKNVVLKSRAKRASTGRSTEYLFCLDDVEIALLSYEDWSEKLFGFVYEIYVFPSFRKQGFGGLILSYAEDLALNRGCLHIELEAKAFDNSVEQGWLFSWYEKKGYVKSVVNEYRMEKMFATE